MPRAVASFTLFGFLLCRLAFSQDGLQLFHKMQAALGGADKIPAIRDFESLLPQRMSSAFRMATSLIRSI
jgi:hypothetical protein